MLASRKGHVAAITALHALGASLEERDDAGKTPLTAASGANKPAAVTELLRLGADVDAPDGSGMTPLMMAGRAGHAAVLRVLLCEGHSDFDKTDDDGECSHLHLPQRPAHLSYSALRAGRARQRIEQMQRDCPCSRE